MLRIIDDITRSWRLTTVKGWRCGSNGSANPLLGSGLYPDSAFAAGMVDRLWIDLHMPEMVADQFVLQGRERVRDICWVALVYTAPINQLRPTRPAATLLL